jgi:hypothetical protein
MNLDNFVVRPQRRIVERTPSPRPGQPAVPERSVRAGAARSPACRRSWTPETRRPSASTCWCSTCSCHAARRARLRSPARSGEGDRRPAGGEVRDSDGARPDGADPGRADRRVVARRDRADARGCAGACAIWSSSSRSRSASRSTPTSRTRWASETAVELPGFGEGTDYAKFRAKAQAFLRAHQDHVAIHKLRMNKALTAADLAELERMLVESGVGGGGGRSVAPRRRVPGLGLFVRSLVGLDREAAKEALSRLP